MLKIQKKGKKFRPEEKKIIKELENGNLEVKKTLRNVFETKLTKNLVWNKLKNVNLKKKKRRAINIPQK